MSSARRVLLLVATLLTSAAVALPAAHAESGQRSRPAFPCTDKTEQNLQIAPYLGTTGLYEVPQRKPRVLLVFAHGYQASSASWTDHLAQAYQHGDAGVAMDYHGTDFQTNDVWKVREGAQDMIQAATFFLNTCPSIKKVVMFGVSMGGNSSGLAVAAGAKKPDGTPLFDYWFDIEGVANLLEEYSGARALAPSGNKLAAGAVTAIQDECGGAPESGATAAACYQQLTLTSRPQDIAGSGVKAVVMIHAVEDGEVPSDQSKQLSTELRALGETTDVFNVLRRNAGETNSELSLLEYANPPFADPFAGHTGESTSTTAVMGTALALLWGLLDGTYRPATQDHLVDNQSLAIAPPPNS